MVLRCLVQLITMAEDTWSSRLEKNYHQRMQGKFNEYHFKFRQVTRDFSSNLSHLISHSNRKLAKKMTNKEYSRFISPLNIEDQSMLTVSS